jgi:endonuclease/exonuclease/phosphatase family metal-dependent hydrolase
VDRFSVATFNLYNFQLPGRRMNPGQKPWTKDEFERKASWISRQLRSLQPDIVGLQELWHRDAMAEVLDRHDLAESYELLAEPANGDRIICGALVRKGMRRGNPEWIDDFPDAVRLESSNPMDLQAPAISVAIPGFSRPVLRFQVALRDGLPDTEVFVTHLKSKLPTRIDQEAWFQESPETFKEHATALGAALSTIRRTAEAAALRVMLTSLMKGTVTPVIVLGDVNDGQHSNTANILTEQPRYLVGDSQGGADIGLYTAQTLQEYRDTRDVYYTHVHNDLRESLDHVLVSEQFYDHSRRRLWLFDGLIINNDHLNEDDHRLTGTGDHGIVCVSFKFRPVASS